MAEELRVVIVGEDKLSNVLDGIRGRLDSLAGGVQALGKIALGGIFAAAGTAAAGFAGALKMAIDGAVEAQKVEAQLEAVLRSTGQAAGLSKEEILSMASALQSVTTYGDEAVTSAANLLLTFTNIGKDVFPSALETVLDMSTALGQDLKSSAIQLGKALQDPVGGVTALRRVGVNFNDAQMKVIKRLVETGRVAEAQRLILKELATEFGGSARAAAETFAGRMEQLKNRLGDAAEAVGVALLPILERLAKLFTDNVLPIIEKGAEMFRVFFEVIGEEGLDLEELGFVFSEFADQFGPLEPLVRGIAEAFWALADIIPQVVAWINQLWAQIQPLLEPVAAWIAQNVQLQDVLIALGIAIAAVVIPALASIVAAAAPVIAAAAALIAAVSLIRQAWESDFLGIRTFILDTLNQIAAWWQAHGAQVIATVQGFLTALRSIWEGALRALRAAAELFSLALQGRWYEFGARLRDIWDAAWKKIQEIGKMAWEAIWNFFTTTDWGAVGRAIVGGIAAGIRAGAGAIIDAAIEAARAALEAAKGFLRIRSPSEVFEGIGMAIAEGWAWGIQRGAPALARASVGLGAMGASITYNTTNNYILNLNAMREAGRIARDFELMRAR